MLTLTWLVLIVSRNFLELLIFKQLSTPTYSATLMGIKDAKRDKDAFSTCQGVGAAIMLDEFISMTFDLDFHVPLRMNCVNIVILLVAHLICPILWF